MQLDLFAHGAGNARSRMRVVAVVVAAAAVVSAQFALVAQHASASTPRSAQVPPDQAVKGGKLSPRLTALADATSFASPRARARALSLPASGVGSLPLRSDGRVMVEIRTSDTSAAALAEL